MPSGSPRAKAHSRQGGNDLILKLANTAGAPEKPWNRQRHPRVGADPDVKNRQSLGSRLRGNDKLEVFNPLCRAESGWLKIARADGVPEDAAREVD